MSKSTLELEVISFAESLPDWGKFLCEKLLSIGSIQDSDIITSYHYLLEDAGLKEKQKRLAIKVIFTGAGSNTYNSDLLLTAIQKIEGVNALAENQKIEFGPNITIVYGSNGSGKSGYVRLFNNAFISKGDKTILPNIYIENGRKTTKAELVFETSGTAYTLKYPENVNNISFRQFSVFDNKSMPVYLNNRNQFEFRPSSLMFFGNLTDAVKKVEEKINFDIILKNEPKDYSSFFDGDSEIKIILNSLSDKTKVEELKRFLPFTETDKIKINSLEEQKAQLHALKREKEISNLEEKKSLLESLKKNIEANNRVFTIEYLAKIKGAITDCITKEILARNEGILNFKSDFLKNIGGPEWKLFIEAADKFAREQIAGHDVYPKEGDLCLLCHQPLSIEAKQLIKSYWAFIKSNAEQESKNAQSILDKIKDFVEKMKFDLLPVDSILSKWLSENYTDLFEKIKNSISEQKSLAESINLDLMNKVDINRNQCQVGIADLDNVLLDIDEKIKELKDKEPTVEIQKISKEIILLTHKEKLSQHITGIESYVENLKWAIKASSAKRQLNTRKITEKEKELSAKYFNQSYLNAFNKECSRMKGSFGIDISLTGSSGTSYRQLLLKGKQPSQVLSEGEQKVISLADFLSENELSGINRGLIFDDPVTSLDEERKSIIAQRLVEISKKKQIIIFTHDLVFVSSLVTACEDNEIKFDCHWIENVGGKPGIVYLKNSPSFEKMYKKTGKSQQYYEEAKKCGPTEREEKLKNGFAALRTSYESLVVFDLFKGVVQRFNERVSLDSLSSVFFDTDIRDELLDSFYQCCRYMEGHSHSDKYAYKKPTVENLNEEILRFNIIKKKISELSKK